MKRIEKLDEIINLLVEYGNTMALIVTPLTLETYLKKSETDKVLSLDNNYRSLKLSDIAIILKIEKLFQAKKITEDEANVLEKKYFEYLFLINEKKMSLYKNLLDEKDKKIPEDVEQRIKKLINTFNSYGINIEKTDIFSIDHDKIYKKNQLKLNIFLFEKIKKSYTIIWTLNAI